MDHYLLIQSKILFNNFYSIQKHYPLRTQFKFHNKVIEWSRRLQALPHHSPPTENLLEVYMTLHSNFFSRTSWCRPSVR